MGGESNSLATAYEAGPVESAGSPLPEASEDSALRRQEPEESSEPQSDNGEIGVDRRGASATLDDELGIAREEKDSRQWEAQRNSELAEGLDVDAVELHDSLRSYSASDILAVAKLWSLDPEDLADARTADLIRQAINDGALGEDGETSEGQTDEESTEEAESEAEDKPEEQKQEEQKPPAEIPRSTLAEMTEEQVQQVRQHMTEVAQRAEQFNHPAMSEVFRNSLAQVLGTDNTPENVERLDKLTQLLEYGGQSLVESVVPALVHRYLQENFPSVIEGFMPGISQSYSEALVSNIWDDVRGNDLPACGTPEFNELAEKVNRLHPELADLDFKDARGNPLPIREALAKKAALTAQLCRGTRFSAESLAETFKRGKASAESNNRRVSAGRALKAGRSGNSFTREQPTSGLAEAYRGRHGSGFDE
jgi:hypothetical protein